MIFQKNRFDSLSQPGQFTGDAIYNGWVYIKKGMPPAPPPSTIYLRFTYYVNEMIQGGFPIEIETQIL